MKKLLSRQNGDTIVEVLISLTLLTFVLAGAYYTASSSYRNDRDAQEHAEAVDLAQSQIEQLRIMGSASTWDNSMYQCVSNHTGTIAPVLISTPVSTYCQSAIDNSSSNFTISDALTTPNITIAGASGSTITLYTYVVKVKWPALAGGTDQVTLYYRVDS